MAFGLGTAFAAIAGTMLSTLYAFTPDFGRSFLLKAFCIIVLGGMESFTGVAVGALVLALIENLVSAYTSIPTSFQDAISFSLLVVVLVAAPERAAGALPQLLASGGGPVKRWLGRRRRRVARCWPRCSCSRPRLAERGTLNDLWNVAFSVVLASAWNLLGGFAGQISLGYSAFVGIGAYTTVLLANAGLEPLAHPSGGRGAGGALQRAGGASHLPAPRPLLLHRHHRGGGGGAGHRLGRGLHRRLERRCGCLPAAFHFLSNYYGMAALALLTVGAGGLGPQQRLRPGAGGHPPGHRRSRGAGHPLHPLQALGPRALRGAGGHRRRAVRDEFPVHLPGKRLRLPAFA